jgi:hypothetical protein
MTMTLALGACASAPSHSGLDRPISTKTGLLNIRFDNFSTQTVDVYLIGTKAEWMLGRVAPGAVASLRIPDEALVKGSMMVQLAVLAGAPSTFAAARDPRAVLSITEPASAILLQRWTFSQGNLTSLPY